MGRASEEPARAEISPPERFRLYCGDLLEWHARLFRWALTGDGDRPDLLPPTPRRVTRGYWERRRTAAGLGGSDP